MKNRILSLLLMFVAVCTAYAVDYSGYYRIKGSRSGKFVTESGGQTTFTTGTTKTTDALAEMWYIKALTEGDGANGYVIANCATGNMVLVQGSERTPHATSATSCGIFYIKKSNTKYVISSKSDFSGNSCWHEDGSTRLVIWNSTESNSLFTFNPVTGDELAKAEASIAKYADNINSITQSFGEITALQNNAAAYTKTLATYFDDSACTQLKADYAAMSAADLRAAMTADGLPAVIVDMAIRVREDKWAEAEDFNHYEKLFRIYDYEIYSDRIAWKNITEIGAFAELVNPSGITVKAGDVLCLYVDASAKTGANLFAEIPELTNFTGATFPLKKGLNVIQAPNNGEVFIGYFCTDTSKQLSTYPRIRVHIEGGTANGCWDASRGMDNNDWAWLVKNALKQQIIHVKGHSTVLTVERNRVDTEKNVEGVLKIWDFIFDREEYLLGNDGQWDGRYRPVINPRESYSNNPNWPGNYGTNHPGTINSKNGTFNYEEMLKGGLWEILHEEGHAHQYPVNFAGLTEVSNNAYCQMVTYEFGAKRSRGVSTPVMIQLFNEGYTWVDYTRAMNHRNVAHYDDCLHVANQMFYKLYLYFHVQGHMPDFWPRVADWMRKNGGISKGSSIGNPTLYYNDYFKFAEACADVSQTDLSEFFQAYGFFKYYEDCVTTKLPYTKDGVEKDDADLDDASKSIRFIGDYGSYYMKMPKRGNAADEKRINDLIAKLRSYKKKAPGLLFIDDHMKTTKVRPESFVAQLKPSLAGTTMTDYWTLDKQGDMGQYSDYTGTSIANSIKYTVKGTKVTVTGSGMVGLKVYDKEGNLVWLANMKSFTVPEEMAAGLTDGSYTLVATLGNDTDLPLAAPGVETTRVSVYHGSMKPSEKATYLVTGNVINANLRYTAAGDGSDVPALDTPNSIAVVDDPGTTATPAALLGRANYIYTEGTGDDAVYTADAITISGDAYYYVPCTYTARQAAFSRTFAPVDVASLPIAVKAADLGAEAKVYVFDAADADAVYFKEATEVAAGQMFLVSGADAEWSVNLTDATLLGEAAETESPAVGAFALPTYTSILNGALVFDAEQSVFTPGTIQPFAGYINSNLLADGKHDYAFRITDTEGIDHITTDASTTTVYTLDGRHATRLESGKTYIIGGRKTIIR